MSPSIVTRTALAAALLLATACSLFRPAWETDVAIVGMRIADVEMFETTAVFTLAVVDVLRRAVEQGEFRYDVDSLLYVVRGDALRRQRVSRTGVVDLGGPR